MEVGADEHPCMCVMTIIVNEEPALTGCPSMHKTKSAHWQQQQASFHNKHGFLCQLQT